MRGSLFLSIDGMSFFFDQSDKLLLFECGALKRVSIRPTTFFNDRFLTLRDDSLALYSPAKLELVCQISRSSRIAFAEESSVAFGTFDQLDTGLCIFHLASIFWRDLCVQGLSSM